MPPTPLPKKIVVVKILSTLTVIDTDLILANTSLMVFTLLFRCVFFYGVFLQDNLIHLFKMELANNRSLMQIIHTAN